MAGRFEGKVALITGGASGIGAATARRFAQEGARVVIADVNEAGARQVAEEIDRGGAAAVAARADVSDPRDVEAMIARAVEAFGRLDVLHNNATLLEVGPIGRLTLDGWNRTLAVNLTGTFRAPPRGAHRLISTREFPGRPADRRSPRSRERATFAGTHPSAGGSDRPRRPRCMAARFVKLKVW